MIRYSLICEKDHRFESWFPSSEAFERLSELGHVACETCGSKNVRKSLMAPTVRGEVKTPLENAKPDLPAPNSQDAEMSRAIAKLRKHVEENSDYVGKSFVSEARAIHDGDRPKRSIYGEASLEEARGLHEAGVPVAPLPFVPRQRTN